jgi:hypothetical protein
VKRRVLATGLSGFLCRLLDWSSVGGKGAVASALPSRCNKYINLSVRGPVAASMQEHNTSTIH